MAGATTVHAANKNVILLEANVSLIDGKPLEGSHRVLARLYSDETEQSWQEIHKEVQFTNGMASIELGTVTSINITDVDISTPNLHLFIEGDEISIPLYSSFYSLKSLTTDHVAWSKIEGSPITIIAGIPNAVEMKISTLNVGVIYYDQKSYTFSGSKTVNWKQASKQKIALTGNTALSFTEPYGPGHQMLIIKQDAAGSRTVTWPSSVKWPSGIAPELSTEPYAIDVISLYYDGEYYLGSCMLDFK